MGIRVGERQIANAKPEGSGLARIGAFVAAIEAGRRPSAFFIYGGEEFLVSEARERIVSALRRNAGDAAEFVSLPGAVEDLKVILTELLSGSLFSSDKIVSVAEFTAVTQKGARAKELLAEFASRINTGLPKDKTLILSICESGPPITAFAKRIKKAAVLNFTKLRSYPSMQVHRDPLFGFVTELLSEKDKTITQDAFLALKDSVETDLRAISGELEKLTLFIGEKSRIDVKDVEAIVSEARRQAVFELTDAVAKKNAASAFKALANLLQENTPPLFVIQSLANQFRSLLQARILLTKHLDESRITSMSYFTFKDNVIKDLAPLVPMFGSASTNLLTKNPFVIHKSLQLATKFDQNELARALMKVSDADAAIKRSLAPPSQLLRGLMFDLV